MCSHQRLGWSDDCWCHDVVVAIYRYAEVSARRVNKGDDSSTWRELPLNLACSWVDQPFSFYVDDRSIEFETVHPK